MDRALTLFARAELAACVDELRGLTSLEASTLRIRALSRLGRLDEAKQFVEAAKPQLPLHGDNEVKAAFCAWSSRVYDRLGDRIARNAMLLSAKGYALCCPRADTWAEVNYIEALALLRGGDRNAVLEALAPSLSSSSNVIRAQALELRAMVVGGADRQEQAHYYEQAWAAISRSPQADQYLAGNVLFNTALLGFELYNRETILKTAERFKSVNWTDGLAFQRFHVMRFVAWGRALEGDQLGAFAALRESASIAPTPASRVIAYIDRAFLAREMGEELFAREEVAHARSVGADIDWESSSGQERLHMLWLAQVIAYVDPDDADRIFARYLSCRNGMPVHTQFSFDPLIEAPESFTAASIKAAKGDAQEARRLFARAFELWAAAGYRWRAAQAAVRLIEIDGGTVRQRSYLAQHAPIFPNSWIAARAKILLEVAFATKDGQLCRAD